MKKNKSWSETRSRTKHTKQLKKVIVAMSGGVDSSVAAALLKSRDFDLVGVFMKFWADPLAAKKFGNGFNRCCSAESAARARKVCQKLGMPFYVLNVENEFKKTVVDYFLKEYKDGRTPNPCVVCNKEIKFKFLLKKMLELKADYIATGHYTRLRRECRMSNVECRTNDKLQMTNVKLLRAKDKKKDQSYFLWRLGQKELRRTLFPVGDYTKVQIRQMAKKWGLPTAQAKESQEVCFIKASNFDFLKRKLGQRPGKIVELSEVGPQTIGEPRTRSSLSPASVRGWHQGLWFYTLGQRKGIGLSGGPYYVLAKNLKKNELVVSKNKKDLFQKEVLLKKVNWLSGQLPNQNGSGQASKAVFSKTGLKVKAQIRYNSSPASATMFRDPISKHWKLVFDRPQFAPSPGQSAVWYSGQELLGGGVIT